MVEEGRMGEALRRAGEVVEGRADPTSVGGRVEALGETVGALG